MAYENPLMTELMVPREPDVAARIHNFYEIIGWQVRNSSDTEYFTYVYPEVSKGVPPTVAYWQTESEAKIDQFQTNEGTEPSIFARGLRLPIPQELVEVCLVVPSDDDVDMIYERGGKLLEHHTHILPRDHAGSQEFRFVDPFNYSLRVTGNPGWEIAESVQRHIESEEAYDPNRAVSIQVDGSEDTVAIVTKALLDTFLKETGHKLGVAERLLNRLTRAKQNNDIGSCLYYAGRNRGQVKGIRVDKFRTLINTLKVVPLTNVGPVATELLDRYAVVLFPETPAQ